MFFARYEGANRVLQVMTGTGAILFGVFWRYITLRFLVLIPEIMNKRRRLVVVLNKRLLDSGYLSRPRPWFEMYFSRHWLI